MSLFDGTLKLVSSEKLLVCQQKISSNEETLVKENLFYKKPMF